MKLVCSPAEFPSDMEKLMKTKYLIFALIAALAVGATWLITA
jgi:hypothetical protein